MKNELKNKMLTVEQAETIKEMIVFSMESAYTDKGELPAQDFYLAAGSIAEEIIRNVQMSLIQNNVFGNIANKSKSTKKAKKVKKAKKSIKRNK